MSNKEKKFSFDAIKWFFVLAIIAAAVVANYYYSQYAAPIRAIAWIFVIFIALGVAYMTDKGHKAFSFLQDARTEMRKVTWPLRQETTQTTLIVIAVVVIVALILWGVDSGLLWLVGKLTRLGG